MPRTKRGREIMARNSRKGMSEKKYFDFQVSKLMDSASYRSWNAGAPNNTSTGAATSLLFAPSQGTTIYTRQGRKTWISNINMKGRVYWNNADMHYDDQIQGVRIIVLLDTQVDKNAAAFDPDDVMATSLKTGTPITTSFSDLVGMNLEHLGRFRILKDKTYLRPNWGGTTGEDQVATSTIKIKHKFLKPVQVNYSQGGSTALSGDQENVVDNGLRLIYMPFGESSTYTGGGVGEDPVFRIWGRVGFYDHHVSGVGGGSKYYRPRRAGPMVWVPRGGPLRRRNPW
jgi:hypothetical protein